jgi:hypothetical protein
MSKTFVNLKKQFKRTFRRGKNWTITVNWRNDDKPLVWGSFAEDIKPKIEKFIEKAYQAGLKEGREKI